STFGVRPVRSERPIGSRSRRASAGGRTSAAVSNPSTSGEAELAERTVRGPSAATGVGETEWLFVTPELPVADVRATQAYYRDVLGFRIAWVYEERYGAVYNGRTEI